MYFYRNIKNFKPVFSWVKAGVFQKVLTVYSQQKQSQC